MLADRCYHALGALLLISMLGGTAFASEKTEASVASFNKSAAPAKLTIERLDDALLDIMKRADQLGLMGRLETIEPVIRRSFDLPFMARATVGQAWKELSDEDRRLWVETFSSYTIYKLADRFDGFSGQSFEIVGQKPASLDTLIIQTLVKRPSDDDVRLDYRMRKKESSWKVIDIYAKGRVSEIALRRSEYTAILKRGGMDLLIESVSAMMDSVEKQAKD